MNRIIVICLISLFAWSCDNEIDVSADWKEVPVIYGLIDPAASFNYIRINRAYLNEEGDALTFAKESDSLNFEALTVVVTEFEDGIEKNTIQFERVLGDTNGLTKDYDTYCEDEIRPGSFSVDK